LKCTRLKGCAIWMLYSSCSAVIDCVHNSTFNITNHHQPTHHISSLHHPLQPAQVYRNLCKTHKTFRERSEQADVATEISLQPYNAYGTDGCILFSDILTPFPAMGVDFDITEKEGPKMKTWTTMVRLHIAPFSAPL
jgi:uroporphyrinogen-III decarboxylase